jgi:hypothetical protein
LQIVSQIHFLMLLLTLLASFAAIRTDAASSSSSSAPDNVSSRLMVHVRLFYCFAVSGRVTFRVEIGWNYFVKLVRILKHGTPYDSFIEGPRL